MIEVYGAIYGSHYALEPDSLEVSRRNIRRDLEQLNIQSAAHPEMKVLNIGTGREAFVFHELGFRKVFHVDLSPLATSAINALRAQSHRYLNIVSVQHDVCGGPLPFDDELDLIYLNGVVHHLRAPHIAMQHLVERAHSGAVFFCRIYRSGSLLFLVVDFIRRFLRYEDRHEFAAAVQARPWVEAVPWLAMDMWDDFFVPILNLFPPEGICEYFTSRGWHCLLAEPNGASHSIALAFQQGHHRVDTERAPFPLSQDQLQIIGTTPPEMRLTIVAMQSLVESLRHSSPGARLGLAMEMYRIACRETTEFVDTRRRELQGLIHQFPNQTTADA
jgi:SAM-dependent methyltransferase